MIAVSEPPLEYIPRGRPAVDEHPGPTESTIHQNLPSENILLQRLQNVNISANEEHNEFWCIREIYEEFQLEERNKSKNLKQYQKHTNKRENIFGIPTAPQECANEYVMNSEEELYVKKHTAVWTRGLSDQPSTLPRLCFTCETPIKFAFFCNKSFTQTSLQFNKKDEIEDGKQNSICLIDQTSLRVYCRDGEDFLSNLEFPISHVWPTSFGILLEKVASSTIIHNHTISMPRLFSLSHPLDEICPVLNKSATNVLSYLIETDYTIIFSSENSNILVLYDTKIGKHFISKLRKATPEEIQYIGERNETVLGSTAHQFSMHKGSNTMAQNTAGQCHFSQNSSKFSLPPKNSTHIGRTSLGASNYSTHLSKLLNCGHSLSGAFTSNNRSAVASPLNNLQSTIGHHSISVQDIRKIDKSEPLKPIVPELCLEHIWTENTFGNNRDFCEMSTKAFFHTDLVGQTFLCYLLPRSCKLQMVRLNITESNDLQISAIPITVVAKDAVALERMNMIAVLDPSGSLILYTGSFLVSKVHIPNNLADNTSSSKVTASATQSTHYKSPNTSFPRRSSLLPTAQKPGNTTFEDELHMLSPVHPLQPQFTNRSTNICLGLRDPAVNRLTLMYSSGKMVRITLPLINETILVTRCFKVLKQVLKKDQYIQLITKWYGTRNRPGSRDYSIEREWGIFSNVLLDLMGYSSIVHDTSNSTALSFSAEEPKKRKKDDEIQHGTEEDWQFMMNILEGANNKKTKESNSQRNSIDNRACLFSKIPAIFYNLHLLYEDFKLDDTMQQHLFLLAEFLHQMAVDMNLQSYTFHYSLDFPLLVRNATINTILDEYHVFEMMHNELLEVPAPNVFNQLECIIRNKNSLAYSYVENVNDLSRTVLQVVSLVLHGTDKMRNWIKPLEFPDSVQSFFSKPQKRFISTNVSRSEQVIQMLISMKITRKDIEHLPVAINLIISECLEYARLEPPIGCTADTYELILRSDLAAHANLQNCDFLKLNRSSNYLQNMNIDTEDSLSARCPPSKSGISQMEGALDDGMDNIDTKLLSLRYSDDMRITEVRRLLTSSEPVTIDITQSPGTSDHEFIEEQEKQLFALCTRTMTLPLGRGMFTLRTSIPTPTESMPIPKLCLTGKEPLKGATVEMQQIEFPANMSLWPTFHNGVAAGLKISPNARDVDSTWIVYNKPKGQADISTEHAGFLMALGLNDHLKTLSFMSIYEYLVKCDDMTSVGLLLGISATHRGTMNSTTTKLLSVHIEALLPATALELDIPQNIQVASLMGIGLLYQGTSKRHIAEVLMQEIGRPPGPEMENCVERESYALTAGLALGLVTLGQGESPAGLRDLQLPDNLHYYMVGGNKRIMTGSQKEKYKLPSFQVREGDQVNIDITAPGAILALGLMFFKTDNKAVAEWMNPPNTRYLLDLVRPDLLLLRTIAHGLIMWSEVQPDEDWLRNQFPANLRFDVEKGPQVNNNEDIDYEAITQAYCNIIAGAAFCIGLKFAGSENPVAFKTLRKAIKSFLGFSGKYIGEFAGRNTIENSLMVILLAISLVFAGSGNLEILRIIRYLRSRIGPQYLHVTYGSHMAIHMALGFLFLGAGRFTISKTAEAVAALVCALFPKFPANSNDNRYHLQAFRHLYVLALEPRLFLPRDIDTRKLCLCNISVLEIGSKELRRLPMAPCMLPELSTIQKVIVDDSNYWPVSFEKGRNWNQLVKALENSACIEVKKRSGCLSHIEDPDRLKSLFSQTLTSEQYVCWEIDAKTLERFSNEPYVVVFTDRFLHSNESQTTTGELALTQRLAMLFYNAVVKDKMHVFPIYLALYKHVLNLKTNQLSFNDIWQLKLVSSYLQQYPQSHILISRELIYAFTQQFDAFMDNCRQQLAVPLRQFIGSRDFESHIIANLPSQNVACLVAVIIYNELTPNLLNLIVHPQPNYISYIKEFQKLQLSSTTTHCLLKILQATST